MRLGDQFRWVLWLSLCQLGTMLSSANYQSLLPILQKEWLLTNAQAGWIFSSYQVGYILFVFVLTSVTDYVNPKYIYISTAFWSGVSGALFPFLAEGFWSALLLRALMGIGLAGTYMPGVRMVSEQFSPRERGRAVGIFVASITLGMSMSLFLTGFLSAFFSWRWVFLISSAGPVAAGAIACLRIGEISWKRSEKERAPSFFEILRNRPAMGIIGGYVAHMWEMYGMRGWMVAFVAASLLVQKGDLSRAVSMSTYVIAWSTLLGAVAIATGGAISDRFGRIHTITVIMVGSGLLSLTLGWAIAVPYWLLAILCLLYGFMVAADSSVLSTGVVEMAHPGGLGRTMAIQSLLGWTAASVSPVVFGYILDVTNPADALARYGYFPNWGWAFMLLGVGGLMGLLAIGRSKKKVAS